MVTLPSLLMTTYIGWFFSQETRWGTTFLTSVLRPLSYPMGASYKNERKEGPWKYMNVFAICDLYCFMWLSD